MEGAKRLTNMKTTHRTVVSLAMLALAIGCGGSAPGGTTPDGAAGGSDGGASGNDGAAGNGAGTSPPSCLQALFAACPTDGACTRPAGDGGSADSSRRCFASGVVATSASEADASIGPTTIVTVTKSDGSVCYTLEDALVAAHGLETGLWTWKDPAGNTVATASYSTEAGSSVGLACAVGGVPTSYGSSGGASGGGPPWLRSVCGAGTCP
jgi:hypothetical protein